MSARPISRDDIEYLVRGKLGLAPKTFSIANPLYESIDDRTMEDLGAEMFNALQTCRYGPQEQFNLLSGVQDKFECNSYTMLALTLARLSCVRSPDMRFQPSLAAFGYFRDGTGEDHQLISRVGWQMDPNGVPMPDMKYSDGTTEPSQELTFWEPQPTPPAAGGLLACLRRVTLSQKEISSNSLFQIN